MWSNVIERTTMKKVILSISILLLVFLFSGCVTILSSDTTVKLDKTEQWEITQELLFEGASFKEYGQTVTDGLNTLVTESKTSGIDVTFKQLSDRQGNVPYSISIKGAGIDKLNETLGNADGGTPAFTKVTVNGETVYGFQMDSVTMSSGGLDLGYSPEFSFTVEGMKILETNGKKNSSTSVTWKNPGEVMTATLSPAASGGSFAWWIIPLAVVGLAGLVFLVLFLLGVFKKKQPQPQYTYPVGYAPSVPPPPAPMPPAVAPSYTPRPAVVAPPPQPMPVPVPPPPAAPAPVPPAAPSSMPTIMAPRGGQVESTGEETIMGQHFPNVPPPEEK